MKFKPLPIVLGVAMAVVVSDRLTKLWAESALTAGEPRELLGSILKLHLVHNPGAAFSFLTNATWVFTLIALGISAYIIKIGRAHV